MTKTLGLMNSIYSPIRWAPPNDQGGEMDELGLDNNLDEDEDEDADLDGSGKPDPNDPLGVGLDEEFTDDNAAFMAKLFDAGDEDGDDDDLGESETPEQIKAAETALAAELKAGLESLALPPDLIPDDFDPSDRKQLSDVLAKVQANTAQNAIKLMFKPVQATLNRMATMLRREIRDEVRSGSSKSKEQQTLESEFPALANPVLSGTIKTMYSQARKRYPDNLSAAIKATRRALSTVGIDPNDAGPKSKRRGSTDDDFSPGARVGSDALDSFGLTLPTKVGKSSARQRLVRR